MIIFPLPKYLEVNQYYGFPNYTGKRYLRLQSIALLMVQYLSRTLVVGSSVNFSRKSLILVDMQPLEFSMYIGVCEEFFF